MTVTAELADFIVHTDADRLGGDERAAARSALVDTVGVALAACDEPAVTALLGVLEANGGAPTGRGCTVLGHRRWLTPLDAALANGTAAHALDFDDTQSHVRGHASAAIVAAALAAAEHNGSSGLELIAACLLGMEVAGKVGASFGASHARQGFHSTATLGVLGAAAASARLILLEVPEVVAALGIAASSAGGLRVNFGTMTKPVHAGNAARAGLFAALLAGRGVSATEAVLDGRSSFTNTFSPGDGSPEALGRFGAPWEAVDPGIAVKKYPCCNRSHRAVDAVLAITARVPFAPGEVERVEVHMPAGEVDENGRVGPMTFPRPVNGLQGKFSMPYVIASAICDGGLRIANFTDEAVARPALRAFLERVRPIADSDRPATDRSLDFVEVDIFLSDGRRERDRVFFSRGDPRGGSVLPFPEVAAKFRDCASVALLPDRVERSLELFARLDDLADVRELTAMLVPGGVPGRP